MERHVLTIPTQGPFNLRRSALVGFGHRAESGFDGVMRLAFTVDGTHEQTAGVAVRQDGDELHLTIQTDADPQRAADQVARVLSVHVDGTGFADLARRDPVATALYAAADGLRPPQFYSPYEAAAWSILSARRSAAQGRVLRQRVSEQLGTAYDVAGERHYASERLCGETQPMTDDEFTARAEAWRPYRMWMTFLARALG